MLRNFIYFNAQLLIRRSFTALNPLLTFSQPTSLEMEVKNIQNETVWCETWSWKRISLPGKYLFCQYSQLQVVGWRNIIHNNNCNHAKLLKEFASLSDLFFLLCIIIFLLLAFPFFRNEFFKIDKKANNKITILRPWGGNLEGFYSLIVELKWYNLEFDLFKEEKNHPFSFVVGIWQ